MRVMRPFGPRIKDSRSSAKGGAHPLYGQTRPGAPLLNSIGESLALITS